MSLFLLVGVMLLLVGVMLLLVGVMPLLVGVMPPPPDVVAMTNGGPSPSPPLQTAGYRQPRHPGL